MKENPNQIHADAVQTAMEAFDAALGDPGGVDNETLFQLLIASMLHKCDAEGWDFAAAERNAREIYLNELHG